MWLDACVEFDDDPALVAAARSFAASTLAEWEFEEAFRDDAVLVVSELTANAVLHARTRLRVTLRSDGLTFVRVEVYDGDTHLPRPETPPPSATRGRGLALVAAVAGSWGAESESHGKTVWALLEASPPPASPTVRRAGQAAEDVTS